MAPVIKNSPTSAGDVRDTGLIPGQADPLEWMPLLGMAAHSCILAWRILWTEEPGRSQNPYGQRRP